MGLLRLHAAVFRLLRRLLILEKEVDGRISSIYEYQRRWRDTFFGAYTRCRTFLSNLCPGVFLNMAVLDMSYLRHTTSVEYLRRTHKMF